MIRLAFYPSYISYGNSTHNISNNPPNAIFINSNGGAIKIKEFLTNVPTNVGFTRGGYFVNQLRNAISAYCDNSQNVSYNRFFLNFTWGNVSELEDIITTFANFSFNFQIAVSVPGNPSGFDYSMIGEFAFNIPDANSFRNALNNVGQDNFIHSLTGYNINYYSDSNDFDVCDSVNIVNWAVGNNYYRFNLFNDNPYPEEPVDCEDLRSSESTQGVYITTNWKDILGNDLTEDYELLFQPDSQHTSGSISFTNQFQALMGLKEVTCRFNRGVIRDSGYIKINGHIETDIYKVDMLGNTLVPVFENVTENFIIQFMFEPCCDYPVSVSETYSDAIASLEEEGANLMMGKLVFDSIEWHGFALLQNYCCDDVDCDDDVKMIGSDEPIYIGVGGGGDNVDITCICDNLELINDTLTSKFTTLNTKMDSLIETIEDKELSIEIDDCVCNNLESISDKLDSLDDIKDSIDNKVIPVTDVSSVAYAITNKQIPITDVSGITTAINNKQIPVTDVSGITTAINNKQIPVTNVSGIESAISNKQIPVTDVSGLNTSLGNIDSSLGQIDNTIAGGTASIGSSIDDIDLTLGSVNTTLGGIDTSIDDVGTAIGNQSFTVDTSGLTCTDSQGNEEGLACILKNALNNRDGKGLADVIDDKDVSSYVDVAVEPYDMVNIRRAFKDDDIQEG